MFAQIATIDGPPASGKTTMAKILAKEFNLIHLDSGAIFRSFTLHCMSKCVDLASPKDVALALSSFHISFTSESVLVNGHDVTSKIRDPEVTGNVHYVSFIPIIREFVSNILLSYGRKGKVVCDGRNVGAQVFPDASVKFYLTADLNERVLRRYQQLLRSNPNTCFSDVYKALKEREEYELERNILIMPKDAIVIDNTNLSIQETLQEMRRYME